VCVCVCVCVCARAYVSERVPVRFHAVADNQVRREGAQVSCDTRIMREYVCMSLCVCMCVCARMYQMESLSAFMLLRITRFVVRGHKSPVTQE